MKKLKKNLIIGGGGIKGLSFLGTLENLFKIYPFEQFENFSGVSIGSFIIVMLIIDYNINDLKDFFINNDLYYFTDYKLSNLLENYGLDKGVKVLNLIKAFFITKNIDIDITFLELYNKTKKNIYICGSNISKDSIEYFSYNNTPNMKVLDALRISISVPILFTPILFNNDYYIDGVYFEYYPIEPFKNDIDNTISILLDFKINLLINSFDSYLKKLLFSLYNHMIHNKMVYKDNKNIYNILNIEENSLKFDLNIDEKNKLFNIGTYSFTNKFMNNVYEKLLKKHFFNKLIIKDNNIEEN